MFSILAAMYKVANIKRKGSKMGSNCFDFDMATSLTIHSDLEGTQNSVTH